MKTPPPKLYGLAILGRFIGSKEVDNREELFGRTFAIEMDATCVDVVYARALKEAAAKGINDESRICVMYFQIVLDTVVRHLAIRDEQRYISMAIWSDFPGLGTIRHPMYDDLVEKNPELFVRYDREIGVVEFDPKAPTLFNASKRN